MCKWINNNTFLAISDFVDKRFLDNFAFGRLRTSSEDFGLLRKTSDFFGNLRKWSCRLQKSQNSQDKNLTFISQKKLAGIFFVNLLQWASVVFGRVQINYQRTTVISAHQNIFCELVEITFWLVHASYSLLAWQVVNLTFFAPCIWWLLINCKVFLLLGLFFCCTTNYWTKYYTQYQEFHKALLYELISTLTRKGLVLYYSQAWSSISPKMPLINLVWFKSWINL